MFNQDSYLVAFWAERKVYKGAEVPNLFNLIEEVNLYIENNFHPVENDEVPIVE